MKQPDQLLVDVRRRLRSTWHLDAVRQPGTEPDATTQPSWPHAFPLGSVAKASLEAEFEHHQKSALAWRDWAAKHNVTVTDAARVVHGTTQRIPTHVTIESAAAAARLCGREWTDRLTRGRARAAVLRDCFGHVTDLARIVRDVDGYTDVDFDLLCATATWFREHSAADLTPRQVPIPGLHAKWLNTRQATVATLAGKPTLGLLPRHPARLHFTYLDPDHRARRQRWHDSATVGDPASLAYTPTVTVISENKDTAVHFPELPTAVSVEGMGHGGTTAAASFSWLRDCPVLLYWGDMDAAGFEILNGFRQTGLAIASILMDLPTYERYERFGTSTDARGNPLAAATRRPLSYLTDAEQRLYHCLTDPAWTRYRRVEQERIPLSVAADAVRAVITALP